MHSAGHAKRAVALRPPASPSAPPCCQPNEKMRHPADSPARKRAPWSSPSKKTAMMQSSPGRSASSTAKKLANNNARSLPAAPSLSGAGPRQTPPVQPYATTHTRLLHSKKRNSNSNDTTSTSNATRAMLLVVAVSTTILLPATLHRVLLSASWGAHERASEQVAHAVPALNGLLRKSNSGNNNNGQPTNARRVVAIDPDGTAAAGSEPIDRTAKNVFSENKNKKDDASTTRKRKRNEKRARKEAATATTAAEGSNNHQNDGKAAAAVADSTPSPRFAYVYLVGGCDPARPAYRHFLYNIMVSTHLQRQEGSKSDVIVLVQMSSSSSSQQGKLPDSDLAWLRKRDIRVRYVPTPTTPQEDSFDQLMLDKLLHVVRLTEYERVLFADADMLLRGSLDYLFRLSVAGVLAPNVVFAGRHQPAQGGLFMVAPKEGDADVVQKLIENRRRGQFDVDRGWGRTMNGDQDDHYELVSGKKGRHWDFSGADADEGLLYHFVKYEKKNVSIFQKKKIQNWGVDDDGNVAEQRAVDLDVIVGGKRRECWATTMSHKPCQAPHSDYIHFPGKAKPWLDNPEEYLAKGTTKEDSPHHFWWKSLKEANAMFELGLDFDDWKIERPLLGLHANHLDAVAIVAPKDEEKTTKDKNKPTSPFAYAYVVGGCDPDKPAYRSFLQNIFSNTNIQREEQSTADVVVFFQMLFSSEHTTLPDEDLRLLNALNIQVEMIPKSEEEGFDKIMMEKFRILELKQYERILYLDSDVMVRGSLDYLFTLSKNGELKRNVIFADEYVPAAGSIFMVTPKEGNWDRVLELVREKEERGSSLPMPHWDETVGWGQKFVDGDAYELLGGKKDSSWDFLGASSDLGLLYHWAKYEDKSVSIIMKETVQHWDVDDKGIIHLDTEEKLEKVFRGLGMKRKCWVETMKSKPCIMPHSDFVHFPSTKKPWLHSPPKAASSKNMALDSPLLFWFYALSIVNKKLDMGLDYSDWKIEHRPLLGMHPSNIEAVVSVPDAQAEQKSVASQQKPAEYAYAYVIGGCKPEKPSYVYYFYDILINTYLQRQEGSTADVVVFVQMSFESAHDTITEEDQRLFNAFNIKVEYIPKAEDESFYRIMLDKFLTLGLIQYKRVMFLDGDVMTRGSMDYLFDLSVQGILKENVVFAGQTEPANGGTFMLAPKEGSWDRVLDIIREKEERGAAMPYPHWNDTIGWGHEIEKDDYIQLLSKTKRKKWEFYGAFADQGLLYHWTKYVEKSLSIVFRHEIQNWGQDEDGKVHLEKWIQLDELAKGDIKPVKRDYCWKNMMKMKPCVPPHSDFVHFTGTRKPWLGGPPKDFGIASERESSKHYWFYVLDILNKKLDMKLDFDNWEKYQRPSLGMYPKEADVAKTSYAASAK